MLGMVHICIRVNADKVTVVRKATGEGEGERGNIILCLPIPFTDHACCPLPFFLREGEKFCTIIIVRNFKAKNFVHKWAISKKLKFTYGLYRSI